MRRANTTSNATSPLVATLRCCAGSLPLSQCIEVAVIAHRRARALLTYPSQKEGYHERRRCSRDTDDEEATFFFFFITLKPRVE